MLAEYFYNPSFQLPKRDIPVWIGKRIFGEEKHWKCRLAAVKDFIGTDTQKPRRILDLCCAGAYPSRSMARETNDFFVGLDICSKSLEFARERILEENLIERVRVEQGDILSIPFADDFFDISFCIGGFDYLDEFGLNKFLNEVKRVTKEQFVFTSISTEAKRRFVFRFGLQDHFNKKHNITYHKFYTKEELLNILEEKGFLNPKITKAEYTWVLSVEIS